MGITVLLKNRGGTVIATFADDQNILHRILPKEGDGRFPCLSGIDWYDDTVFSPSQAPQLQKELALLREELDDLESHRVAETLQKLATRLKSETQGRLEFVGD